MGTGKAAQQGRRVAPKLFDELIRVVAGMDRILVYQTEVAGYHVLKAESTFHVLWAASIIDGKQTKLEKMVKPLTVTAK